MQPVATLVHCRSLWRRPEAQHSPGCSRCCPANSSLISRAAQTANAISQDDLHPGQAATTAPRQRQQQRWQQTDRQRRNEQRQPRQERQPMAERHHQFKHSMQQQQQQQHWQQQQRQEQQGSPGATQPPATGKPPYLVVVEGLNDLRAVRRAVPGADVYVLGTSTAADSPAVLQELQAAAGRYRGGLLLLLDPDVAGRQARAILDQRLPGRCLHAFLPSPLATADAATKYHDAGNVGVEHAPPAAIRAALASPRRSSPDRQLFDREQLMRWGLVAELHARGGNVTQRRSLVCAYLGLGDCDGKQLLKQLNRYGFTMPEVESALEWAERSSNMSGSGSSSATSAPGQVVAQLAVAARRERSIG